MAVLKLVEVASIRLASIAFKNLNAFDLFFFWLGKIKHMGASLNGGTPKHPKMIIFSGKTHGCWVPPF